MKYCPNCGKKLEGSEKFCGSCGTSVNQININKTNVLTTTEEFSNKSKKLINSLKNKISNLITKYRKQLLIGTTSVVAVLIIALLYGQIFGFEKLSWNKEYKDLNLKYVSQTNLKLGVLFSDDEKVDEIKYKTTCGKLENKGLELIWDLSNALGKCEITASYKLKKISKEFNVISPFASKEELVLNYEIDLESDEDLDLDGLTNKEEKELDTNPILSDSDMDGLNDNEEINESKTDPNKKDTDDDGLSDYDEIELGLNPLTKISKNDAINDGDRTLTYNYDGEGLNLTITGKGNIASTIVEITSNTKISNKVGLIDNLYTFYTDGKIDTAVVTISYTMEDIEMYNLNEDNLSIYYYNEKESKYEKIDTTVNKVNKTLTATLSHFSNYVVGDSSIVKEKLTNQVLFVLDNSWSMYTNEQYIKITGNEYPDGTLDGFDKEGLRFTLTSNLISTLASKGFELGLSEFRRDYANALNIGSSEKSLKDKLNNMNGIFITNVEGTNITNALNKGIKEFSKDSDNKYIIILTDGQDSSLKYNTSEIIEDAISKDVKICSIGFGGGSYNTELANISNGTGCNFYSSSNASGLTELFENVSSELNDNLVDVDKDNKEDGILLADSGFIVNKDGFSFANYGTNFTGGHCYGMALFAELYYKNQLPSAMSAKTVNEKTTESIVKVSSYPYDLNNTYFTNGGNLFDYKLQTNALKYDFGFDYFGEQIPADLRTLNDTTLAFSDKYKSEINSSGIYDLLEEQTGLSKDEQLRKWGVHYQTAENPRLNEDKMQSSIYINNDDKQMFNAIYTLYLKQNETIHYSSGMDIMLWLRNQIGSETVEYDGSTGFINILKSRLQSQDAPVMTTNYTGNGLHALNAISLVQDIENPNYYYIGVYDNNYPGEKRYVDIKCNKSTCVTVANEYYNNSGEPLRITPSLEYDLEYLK